MDPFIEVCLSKDRLLRGRVRLMGNVLGEVIKSQSGPDVLRRIEYLRKGFIRLRERFDKAELEQLKGYIERLSAEEIRPVIRAYTTYFQLVNIAEENFYIASVDVMPHLESDFGKGLLIIAFDNCMKLRSTPRLCKTC